MDGEWFSCGRHFYDGPVPCGQCNRCPQWRDGHHFYGDDSGDEQPRRQHILRCDCGATTNLA